MLVDLVISRNTQTQVLWQDAYVLLENAYIVKTKRILYRVIFSLIVFSLN